MLKVIKVRHKYITVELDGEQMDISKNLFTNHYQKGDRFNRHAEIILGNGDGGLICSCCQKDILLSDINYDGWKEILKSKFCRHCGASFINILDISNNQRFEEFSKSTLEQMGF